MKSFCHHKDQAVLGTTDGIDAQNVRQNGIPNIRQKHTIACKRGQSSFPELWEIYCIHRGKKGFQLLPPSEATLEFVRPKVCRKGGQAWHFAIYKTFPSICLGLGQVINVLCRIVLLVLNQAIPHGLNQLGATWRDIPRLDFSDLIRWTDSKACWVQDQWLRRLTEDRRSKLCKIHFLSVEGLPQKNRTIIWIFRGAIGCSPNSVPMVLIVFSRDSWGWL